MLLCICIGVIYGKVDDYFSKCMMDGVLCYVVVVVVLLCYCV